MSYTCSCIYKGGFTSQVCDTIVSIFDNIFTFNRTSDFENEQLPDNQVFIHVWMDSNLREIGDIIRHERPELKLKKLGFSLVYNEPRSGTWKLKTLGNLVPMKITRYEHLNLRALKFRPGNYISLRVY